MAKRSTTEIIENFKQDYILLKNEGIAHGEIAEKMKVEGANLSSYVNGAKRPGAIVLGRFYAAFRSQLYSLRSASVPSNPDAGLPSDPDRPSEQAIPPEALPGSLTGDGSERSLNPSDEHEDHIQTLKSNNKELHLHLGSVIKNNEILAISNQKLVESLLARLDQPNK